MPMNAVTVTLKTDLFVILIIIESKKAMKLLMKRETFLNRIREKLAMKLDQSTM